MNGTIRAGTAMIALVASFGMAVAQQAPQQQPGQPSPQPPASAQEQKSSGTTAPQQTDRALQTESGRAGKQEAGTPVPTSTANTADSAALLNGRLAAPGSPQDSQSVSSKVSPRNAALDKMPMMAKRP